MQPRVALFGSRRLIVRAFQRVAASVPAGFQRHKLSGEMQQCRDSLQLFLRAHNDELLSVNDILVSPLQHHHASATIATI
jgi:hypothetical protein